VADLIASLVFPSDPEGVLRPGARRRLWSLHQRGVRDKADCLDMWDGFAEHLQPGIECHVGSVTDLSFLSPSSVDFVFASNLFEHITQEDCGAMLRQLRSALSEKATLNIVQPNYYYCYREYFDNYTHRTIYTHTSITDFLEANGYDVIECVPRFLSLTIKSPLPVSPLFIRLCFGFRGNRSANKCSSGLGFDVTPKEHARQRRSNWKMRTIGERI